MVEGEMDGRHALTVACTSGHPPRRTTASTRKAPQNAIRPGSAASPKKKQEARALDGPNSNTPWLLLKFFLC